MAFDQMTLENDVSNNIGHHDPIDICGCAMCENGSEDQWGVDGTYNVAYASVSSDSIDAILAGTGKDIFTWDEAAAQISRWNVKWDDDGTVAGNDFGTPGQITYGFLQGDDLSTDTSDRDYREMTSTEIAFTLLAINEFEEVANMNFVRVNGADGSEYLDAQADAEMDFQAIDSYNGGWMSGSVGNSVRISNGTSGLETYGSWAYKTAMHEIGHGVGLPHPGDYNGSGATTYENQADYAQDTYMYTVMSYWSHTITGGDTFERVYDDQGNSAYIGGYATGLLLHDIAALHRLYGANMSTRDGDTVYGFNSTEAAGSHWNLDNWDDFFVASIWDAGGIDTIDASGYYEDQLISLVQEEFSSLGGLTYNLSIARGAVIENAIGGAGDDILIGNSADNILNGGDGLDIVDYSSVVGGLTIDMSSGTFTSTATGTDTLISIEGVIATDDADVLTGDANDNFFRIGDGNDVVNGGDGIDWISLVGAAGAVTVNAASLASGTVKVAGLGTNAISSIEGIEGTEFNDRFIGDDDKQYFRGGAGDDFFILSAGGDELDGGEGSDTLDFRASTTRISITLNSNTLGDGGDFGAFTFENFENVHATNGNDFINASAAANRLITYGGNDTIYAQQGDDFVRSGNGDDYVSGWYGNDNIDGGDGDDILEGQFGNDKLVGGNGNDEINGGDGHDRIYGGAGTDVLSGGKGQDSIRGDLGDDTIHGDADRDVIHGGDGEDIIYGGTGNDDIRGNEHADTIYGDDDDDKIRGDGGDDQLYGGNGNDRIYGGLGNDEIEGGEGNDSLHGNEGDDLVNGGVGHDALFGHDGIDALYGGLGNDYLYGGDGDDTLNGGDNDDFVRGDDGNDALNGDDGNDVIKGGKGDDLINGGAGDDRIFGNLDNDIISGGSGIDQIKGGKGIDVIYGDEGDDIIFGGDDVDTIYGGLDNDSLFGDAGNDTLHGGEGDDLLRGDTGNDTLNGDAGNDTIQGSVGDDVINGGLGDDNLYGNLDNDTIAGGAGDDFIKGGQGNDILSGGDDTDTLQGNDGIDTLNGGNGDDILEGGNDADILNGDDGFDLLDGGNGDDTLDGGLVGDVLIGAGGADSLTGGAGSDVFVFNVNDSLIGAEDTIEDYEAGEIIAIANHTFVGEGAFTASGDFEIRYESTASGATFLELDRDGDGVADERIDFATSAEWDFASDGQEITGTIAGPAEGDLL